MPVAMIAVKFSRVGPRKMTWTAELPAPLTSFSMYREIKHRRALMSKDIWFEETGAIVVGGVRIVGHWEVLAPGVANLEE